MTGNSVVKKVATPPNKKKNGIAVRYRSFISRKRGLTDLGSNQISKHEQTLAKIFIGEFA